MRDTELPNNVDGATSADDSPRKGFGSAFNRFRKSPSSSQDSEKKVWNGLATGAGSIPSDYNMLNPEMPPPLVSRRGLAKRSGTTVSSRPKKEAGSSGGSASSPPWETNKNGKIDRDALSSEAEERSEIQGAEGKDAEIPVKVPGPLEDLAGDPPPQNTPTVARPLLKNFIRLRALALRQRKGQVKSTTNGAPSDRPFSKAAGFEPVSVAVQAPLLRTGVVAEKPVSGVGNGKNFKSGGESGWGFLGLDPGTLESVEREIGGTDRGQEPSCKNLELTGEEAVTEVSRSLLELRTGASGSIQLSGQADWKASAGKEPSPEPFAGREQRTSVEVKGDECDSASLPCPPSGREARENKKSVACPPRAASADEKNAGLVSLSENRKTNDRTRPGPVEGGTAKGMEAGQNGAKAAHSKPGENSCEIPVSRPEALPVEGGDRAVSEAVDEAVRKEPPREAPAREAEAEMIVEVVAAAEERVQGEIRNRAEPGEAEGERRIASAVAGAEERVRKQARIQAEARSSDLENRLIEAVAKVEERARAAEKARTETWAAEVEEQLAEAIARTKERLRTEERLRAEANVAEAERRYAQAITEAEELVYTEVRAAAERRIREAEIVGAKALAEAKKQARVAALEEVWEWIRSEEKARKQAIVDVIKQVRAEVTEEGERLAKADAERSAEAVAKAEKNARAEMLAEVEDRIRAMELERELAVAETEERVRAEVTAEGEQLLEAAEKATADAIAETEAKVRSELRERFRKQMDTAEKVRIREIAAIEERVRSEVADEETKVLSEIRENLVRDLEKTGRKARIQALVEARERIREEEARNQNSIAEAESRVRAEVAAETEKMLEADACIVAKAVKDAEKKAREEALSIARERIRSQELANAKALRDAEIRARKEVEGEAELRIRAEVDATAAAIEEAEARARTEALAEVRSHSLSEERLLIQEIMEVEERVRASVFAEAEVAAIAAREQQIAAAAERARMEAEAEVQARKAAADDAELSRGKKERSRSKASGVVTEDASTDQVEDLAIVLGQVHAEERAKAENFRRLETGSHPGGKVMSSIPLPPVDRRSKSEKRARARAEMLQKVRSRCQSAGDWTKSVFHAAGGSILSFWNSLARPFRQLKSRKSTHASGIRRPKERGDYERTVEEALSAEEILPQVAEVTEDSGEKSRFPVVAGILLLLVIVSAIFISPLFGGKKNSAGAKVPFIVALEMFERSGIYFGFERWEYDTAGGILFKGITLYRDREKIHPHFHADSARVELPSTGGASNGSGKSDMPETKVPSSDTGAPPVKMALSLPGAALAFYDDEGKVACLFENSRGILEIEPGKMVLKHFESIAGGVKIVASGPYLLPRENSNSSDATAPAGGGEKSAEVQEKESGGPLFSAVLTFFRQGQKLFEGVSVPDSRRPVLTLTSEFEIAQEIEPSISATLIGEKFEWGGVCFQSVNATFNLKGDGSGMHIQNFQIGREGGYVGGEFTVNFEGKEIEIEKIHSTADLAGLFPALELPWIGPDFRRALGALRFVDSPTIRIRGTIPYSPAGVPVLELAYEDPAGFVQTRGDRELTVRDLKGVLEVGPAGVSSPGFSAALFGGNVRVEGMRPSGDGAPPFDGKIRFTGISLADTARFFGLENYGLSGTLNLEHEGEGIRDLYQVNGGGSFQIEGAELGSFPILGSVRDYFREIDPAFEFADTSTLAGRYTIEFGVLGLKEITVRGNGATLIMDGSLNLANRKSDFRVRAFLDGPLAAKAGLEGKDVEVRGVGDLEGPALTVTHLPGVFSKSPTGGSSATDAASND